MADAHPHQCLQARAFARAANRFGGGGSGNQSGPAPGDADPNVRDALFSLEIKYRAPMVLYYLEGLSVRDIARTLTLPQGTVKNRLFRARALLRERLKEEGFDA